jgi:hypothetical protein
MPPHTESHCTPAAAWRTAPPPTVGAVLWRLLRHPVQQLLRRWNWKAALLSACLRGTLFFAATLKAGPRAALSALLIEAAFYAVVSGFYGALLEALRQAQPVWAATLTVMLLLPTFNHTLEFTLHWLGGTPQLKTALLASILVSLCSACFNLFVMRRGVLLVGADRRSLLSDLRLLPNLVAEFLLVLPLALWRGWVKARGVSAP